MSKPTRPAWMRYGAAVVVTAVALGLKLLLVPLIGQEVPFLVFFGAVLIAADFGGPGPGLLATFLSTLASSYYFMEPFGSFIFPASQTGTLILFFVECIFMTVISTRLSNARHRAEQNELQARELERRILEIADAEQRRIGHDLHDGLGQHLTGIALMTKHLHQVLDHESSKHADNALKIATTARTAVEWTHDLCRSLSPPALEKHGLDVALSELAANAEAMFNIRCVFTSVGSHRRDLPVDVHLYRIAQEAISNAVRHGSAKRIDVRLEGSADRVNIEVLDDGVGIDSTPRSAEGMGLRIMAYRARMIGATIACQRRVDGPGTVVTCYYKISNVTPNQQPIGS